MNWRTDKPTADLIVVNHTDSDIYDILRRIDGKYYLYTMFGAKEIPIDEIKKWADLAEDEGTICPQKQRGRPNKVYEYPVEVPNNDGCLEFIYMTNSTIRKKLRLKKGERAIISIRKEI